MKLKEVVLAEEYLGSCIFEVKVPHSTRNAFGYMHGGAMATYLDICTTVALYAFDEKQRSHVSTALDIKYFNAAKVDSTVIFEARISKIGRNIAYTEGIMKTED
mmetsp:Transcript_13545/g.9751  ORF Transcript_13545/g.9751 Transcript_13545/m.9751 type:complete len:104 (+) Transcript_13545:85-396(+)